MEVPFCGSRDVRITRTWLGMLSKWTIFQVAEWQGLRPFSPRSSDGIMEGLDLGQHVSDTQWMSVKFYFLWMSAKFHFLTEYPPSVAGVELLGNTFELTLKEKLGRRRAVWPRKGNVFSQTWTGSLHLITKATVSSCLIRAGKHFFFLNGRLSSCKVTHIYVFLRVMFLYMVDGWKVVDQKPAWNIDAAQEVSSFSEKICLGGVDS